MLQIIQLSVNTYGVYATNKRGPYNTPLLFKGSLDECLGYRKMLA